MHFDIKLNKNFLKKSSEPYWGFFSRRVVFLEILKLKNPYKIASSLLNVITFLRKMYNNEIQKLMSVWVINLGHS